MDGIHINKNKIRPKVKVMAKPFMLKEGDYRDFFLNLNKSNPIKLQAHILNDVCSKYTFLPKSDIAVVIKAILEVLREHLISGYKLNIRSLFNEMHLKGSKVNGYPTIKVKHTTSKKLKKSI